MKRIAMLMLMTFALVMVSRLSTAGPHPGQVFADEDDGGDDGADSGDDT